MRKHVYDYIIVGSGAAGCTIAKILSDDRRNSVLLLEAGENNDNDEAVRNSALAPLLSTFYYVQYFWMGDQVAQTNVNNRFFRFPGKRILGGGTSINGEQYVRPTNAVIKEWANYLGPLWSPEAVIERFKELEKYNGLTDNPDAHGYNGPIDVRQAPAEPTSLTQKIVSAMEAATSFNEILDYNNPDTPLGPFSRWQLTQKPNGNRESATTAFLTPDVVNEKGMGVNGRRLVVETKSTALRILFNNKTAIGVTFLNDGEFRCAYARKKIIITAGVYSSQILMVSGIGPADVLQAAGVPVLVDNPNVGKHSRNHVLTSALFSRDPNDLPSNDPNALYLAGAFLPDPTGVNPSRRAIQLIASLRGNDLGITVLNLVPKSRGDVKIQATDPLKMVMANENLLSDPADLKLLKDAFKIYITKIAAELNAIDPDYKLISPSLDTIADDAKLGEYIKSTLGIAAHDTSTLRMAPSAAEGAVNYKGEVFGVKDLIVADNTIIPFTVDGNTQAPAFLIALTIAQQLLKEEENS